MAIYPLMFVMIHDSGHCPVKTERQTLLVMLKPVMRAMQSHLILVALLPLLIIAAPFGVNFALPLTDNSELAQTPAEWKAQAEQLKQQRFEQYDNDQAKPFTLRNLGKAFDLSPLPLYSPVVFTSKLNADQLNSALL